MSDAVRQTTVETLLAERRWLESLARSLVRDGSTADDVVQETWIAAVTNPPRETAAMRGWLSRVARNAAARSHRSATRRARREAAAPPRRPEPTPAETVARADAHRHVVDAVMSLDEPYRTAVLLRFFEDVEADEVARRTGVPVETARTRIKRALAMLRTRLDREHGGDGRAWIAALAPLSGAVSKGKVAVATGTVAAAGGAVMASTKTVVVAFVGVAILGSLVTVGGMSLRGGAGPDAPTIAKSDVRSAAASRSGDVAAADRPADRGAASAPNPKLEAASGSEPRSPLAAALDSVEIEAPHFVDGSITGRVTTADGHPVAGVKITASCSARGRASSPAAASASATRAENAVREAIVWTKWDEATRREEVTDASGAYVVSGLVDSDYWLTATAPGWQIRPGANASRKGARPGGTADFVAAAQTDVPVTIVSPAAPLPDEVLVRWTLPDGGGGGASAWWTPADPVIHVPPGTWDLVAEVAKDLRSPPVRVVAESGTAAAPVTLTLAVRDALTGVVRFESGDDGWDLVEVLVRRRPSGGPHDEKRTTARAPEWTYRFEDLAPGDYDVSASLDRRTPLTTVPVRVTPGRVTQDVTMRPPGPNDYLTVRVLGPDGVPLPPRDVSLVLNMRADGSSGSGGGHMVPQRDGSIRFVFASSFNVDVPDPHWFLCAHSQRFGEREAEFEKGKTGSVEIRFDEPAVLDPTIDVAANSPLAGRLRVTLVPAGTSQLFYLSSRGAPTDPVEPGDYVACLWLVCDGEMMPRLIGRTPVRMHRGRNPVTLRVPELSTLTIRVPGVADGTRVFISSARRPSADLYNPQVPAKDGAAEFDEVPPGLYVVQMTVAGVVQDMIVRLPGANDVTFAQTHIAGLAVTVDDSKGALATSGFEGGDLVVSIDGQALETMQQAETLLYGARGRKTLDLDVLRGGRRGALTVDPSKFGSHTERGGWWEPVVR
jgi:RNA polymerase sigma-70 factor (ECF subfamily)